MTQQPNPSQQPSEVEVSAHEFILQRKDMCYGTLGRNASNELEGDYGTWQDWENAIKQLLATEVEKAEKRAYKQGWDSAGGELADTKEQIGQVLDRLEAEVETVNGFSFIKAEVVHQERNKLKGERDE